MFFIWYFWTLSLSSYIKFTNFKLQRIFWLCGWMCAFNFLVKGAVCFANYHYCAKGQDRFAMQGQKLCSSDFLKSVIHKECVGGTIQAYSKFMSGERIDQSLTNFTNFRKSIFIFKRRFQYCEFFIVCDLTFFHIFFKQALRGLERPRKP